MIPAWIYLVVWLVVLVVALALYRAGEREIAAVILVGLLISGAQIVARADDGVVLLNPCDRYTPSDWQWWAMGCMFPL